MAYNVVESCIFIPEISQTACAAWVQAWGTVAAILGAIWISRRQMLETRKLEARKRHLDDLLKTEIVLQLFQEASFLVDQLAGASDNAHAKAPQMREMERLGELEQAFRTLPLFAMPGHGIAVAALDAPKALRDLRLAAKACIDSRVKLADQRNADLPTRLLVEFGRAHEHARSVSMAAVLTCRQQEQLLRRLAHIQD